MFQPERPKDRTKVFCSRKCANRNTARNRRTTKGWTITSSGYKMLLRKDHPNASSYGYVMEHRIVMEAKLGRLLTPNEVVHHKNGDRLDNRPANLVAMEKRKHDAHRKPTYYATCPHCDRTFPARGRVHTVDALQNGRPLLRGLA